MKTYKEIQRSLQILLWLWFGLITSFTIVNVVNIAKLETQIKVLEKDNIIFKEHVTNTKYDDLKNK